MLMEDFGLFIIGVILTLFFGSITFVFWWKIKRLKDLRTLRLGRLSFFYIIFLWITLNGVLGSFIVFSEQRNSIGIVLLLIEAVLFAIAPLVLGFVIPIAIVVLTIKMWRRESKSVSNLLLPIVVLFFIGIDFLYLSVGKLPESWLWLQILSYVYPILSIYLAWQFGIFFLSSWVYGRRVRKMTAPYYVVLGAGLIQGEHVGKLLGNRIRAAVDAVRDEQTILVFSGGQGPDEKISEAQAMQKYAVETLGFPFERTLLENQSRTTYENLVFSDKLLKDKFLFFTSDYHVFRAALFAAQIGLEAQGGRGGKTAMYYRVPAFIREFIAVLNSEKKKHMIWVAVIVGSFIIFAIFAVFIQHYNVK
ncbi:MAG: YdcF family protein [Streptococcaceae bacterium]|uniref:YdcF family protein n=2 Tax=Lactococcus protaetiae TaxID=2592653 RepID=A0A514ZAT0_9LACT|nr:YdcF family protein [Lactococcus protaetiae]MCL2112908.1 YdcF family protein [Streptococcaceae bacterium]QDK71693.1 YdcF family protein [Lactococcus protaetiae]